MPDDSYVEARQRYDRIRHRALAEAQARLRTFTGKADLRLTMIEPTAIAAWQQQWQCEPGRDGGWRWPNQIDRRRRRTRRFEAALWLGDQLCGLCIGQVSAGKTIVSIDLLEARRFPPHELRGAVAACMCETANIFGGLMGASELRIRGPLQGALGVYEKLGFESPNLCAKGHAGFGSGATKAPPYLFRAIMRP